jgi:hypothetical protein
MLLPSEPIVNKKIDDSLYPDPYPYQAEVTFSWAYYNGIVYENWTKYGEYEETSINAIKSLIDTIEQSESCGWVYAA